MWPLRKVRRHVARVWPSRYMYLNFDSRSEPSSFLVPTHPHPSDPRCHTTSISQHTAAGLATTMASSSSLNKANAANSTKSSETSSKACLSVTRSHSCQKSLRPSYPRRSSAPSPWRISNESNQSSRMLSHPRSSSMEGHVSARTSRSDAARNGAQKPYRL